MQPASLPISIIIPMRNEERRIGPCLESILANQVPSESFEILVVDGASTDLSCEIVRQHAARCDRIRLLSNPAKIVATGLNIGLRWAQGSIIFILGAHVVYPPEYLRQCLSELQQAGADAVGGVLKTVAGNSTATARAIALMAQSTFGVGRSRFRIRDGGAYVDTVPYGAYRREVFEQLGTFNEKLVRNQDFEFNARLHTAGGKLYLSNHIETRYYNVPRLRDLARQAFGNGFWLPPMWLQSGSTFRLRHAIPAFFVGSLITPLSLGVYDPVLAVPAALVAILYGAAAVTTAAQFTPRGTRQLFFPLLLAFPVQHFSYGCGTLAGLLHTIARLPLRLRNSGEQPHATDANRVR